MLITNLGQTRTRLLDSIESLSDEQMNQKQSSDKWSVAQVLYHLYVTEKDTAILILNSLKSASKKVDDRVLSFLSDRSNKVKATCEPPSEFFSKSDVIKLLEESRFLYLQAVFNETHETILGEKSVDHPDFGFISLKNLVDSIWLHEQRHIKQIEEIKQELF
ncbi:MAG: hypothetical protein K0S80_3145 [Neobacillus sp.]|nr:hypothetical protein [Neobacillus sp.]